MYNDIEGGFSNSTGTDYELSYNPLLGVAISVGVVGVLAGCSIFLYCLMRHKYINNYLGDRNGFVERYMRDPRDLYFGF